jgi:hypothetical protein
MENKLTQEPTRNLPFGNAIWALKQGKRVTREGWNGKGLFVFMQIPATINADIVPKMQSLPDSVKSYFQKRFEATPDGIHQIHYSNQMALVTPENNIQGWAPSSADTLAEDWTILD